MNEILVGLAFVACSGFFIALGVKSRNASRPVRQPLPDARIRR